MICDWRIIRLFFSLLLCYLHHSPGFGCSLLMCTSVQKTEPCDKRERQEQQQQQAKALKKCDSPRAYAKESEQGRKTAEIVLTHECTLAIRKKEKNTHRYRCCVNFIFIHVFDGGFSSK